MKSSPLQLKNYFVTSLTFTANKGFDLNKPINVQFEDLQVAPSFLMQGDNSRHWEVTLLVKHQPARQDANTPYYFTIEMVGFFGVANEYPAEKTEWLVKTNATSVLFSTVREIVRAITAQGPYGAIMLPTASFYDSKPQDAPAHVVEKVAAKN
ncbi:MAG: protein-export chaperone SecB [Verrucomicrobiia bacterium]|jgi:preprotein translocase subunit SecB